MNEKYQAWIKKNVPPNCLGLCSEKTTEMVKEFPELIRVRGHYISAGDEHEHWWCVTEDGQIVDPTRAQFPFPGIYCEHQEGAEEPVGKCANCGGYIYESSGYTSTVCSRECEIEFRASLGLPL